MSTILAIDTASSQIALAVAVDGAIVATTTVEGGHDHSRLLLPAIDAILGARRGDLAGIAVVRGPGSYAGLRVGVATAHGLALAMELPVRGISTLAAVARAASLHEVTAVHPAGRGEFAAQPFTSGETSGPIRAVQPGTLEGLTTAGEGASQFGGTEVSAETRIQAALLALLPSFTEAENEPVDALYLREPNITVPRRPLNAAAS